MGSLSSALLYSHFTLFPSHFAPLPFTLWTFPSLCTSLLCFFPFSLSLFTSSPLTLLFPLILSTFTPHILHFSLTLCTFPFAFALFPLTFCTSPLTLCTFFLPISHVSPHILHFPYPHSSFFLSHFAYFLFDSQSTHKWPAKVWCQPSK